MAEPRKNTACIKPNALAAWWCCPGQTSKLLNFLFIMPKKKSCENLLAPMCLSSSQPASPLRWLSKPDVPCKQVGYAHVRTIACADLANL